MASTTPKSFDQYWRLKSFDDLTKDQLRPSIKAAGYQVRSKTKKDAMLYYRTRIEKKQLCYDKRTDAELRVFARDRKINPRSPSGWYHRITWIEALMAADGSLNFERFLDLPPELRGLVYGWYVAAFPETLYMPTSPPLSRTSRLVRRECLPVFFGDSRLEVRLSRYMTQSFRDHVPIDKTLSWLFVEGLVNRNGEEVGLRRLRLVGTRCTVDVTLLGAGGGHEVDVEQLTAIGRQVVETEVRQGTETEVWLVLRGIVVRDGSTIFRDGDLRALGLAVEWAYWRARYPTAYQERALWPWAQ